MLPHVPVFFFAQTATPGVQENTILSIAIGIIMLGLGLSLTLEDFTRVARFPKAILIGLACQMLLLPVVCYYTAVGFGLAGVLGLGLMLLAASPGGASANLFSHLSHGDVALNVSLTAINSVLSLFTLPLIVNFSMSVFLEGEAAELGMQFDKVIQVFSIVLVPTAIGMLIRWRYTAFALRMASPVKILSALVLAVVVVGALVKNRELLGAYIVQVGPAALTFNVLSMCVGYFVPLLFKIDRKKAIAIGMEIGIHNGTLAMLIAAKISPNPALQTPAAIYSVIMFVTAAIFGFLVNLGKRPN